MLNYKNIKSDTQIFNLSQLKYLLVFMLFNLFMTSTFAIEVCEQNLNSRDNCIVATPEPSIYIDFILDEYITDSNPLLKSLIYAANTSNFSKVVISYQNPNAIGVATRLTNILAKHSIRSVTRYSPNANAKISKLISLILYN